MRFQGRSRHLVLSLVLFAGLSSGCVHRPEAIAIQRQGLIDHVDRPAILAATKVEDHEPDGPPPAHEQDPAVVRASTEEASASSAGASTATVPGPGPLTLEMARRIALQNNPILAQSQAAADSALGNLEVTDSGFLPTVQGNYGFQAFSSDVGFVGTRGRFPVLPVRGFGPGTQDFHVAEAQLKWTIFQFGKQFSKHDQASLKVEVAKLEAERACQTVAFEVSRAYFRVLEAKSALEAAERSVEKAEAFAKEAGDLLRRGVITEQEKLRTDASLAGVRQAEFDARSEEEVAVAGLNRAMGILINAPTHVADRRAAPEIELTLEQALRLATDNRREIPVVVRGVSIAQGDVAIARADFMPSVSIQAGYSNVTGTGIQNANVGAGGIFLTHELYGGGRRRGQLHSAEAGVRSAIAQAQQVCDGIAYEVNVAYRGLEDARERIGSARAVFDQAQENFRLVTSRSQTGDATPAELIEAQAALTQSEQTFNASIYLYQVAIARLEYALGTELPVSARELPSAMGVSEPAGPTLPEPPPSGESPFRPRSGPAALPGLPPAQDLGEPRREPSQALPLPLPLPNRPGSPDNPRLFGPPSLSRPPYESNSPFGIRP